MLDVYADLNAVAAELGAIRSLLARLVDAVERLSPPPLPMQPVVQAQLTDLHTIDDVADEKARAEREAFAERFGVVPDSPAFDRVVAEYEEEMRRIHGEDGKAEFSAAFREAWRGSR